MSQRNKQATTWNAFDRGRTSPSGSLGVIADDETPAPTAPPMSQSYASRVPQRTTQASREENDLRRRRSSIAMKFNSIRQMGGPNSIDNFMNSYQRAAGFNQIAPVRRGSVTREFNADGDENGFTQRIRPRPPLTSQLSEQIAGSSPPPTTEPMSSTSGLRPPQTEPTETTSLLPTSNHEHSSSLRPRFDSEQDFSVSHGSISRRLSQSVQRRASILIQEQIETSQRAREDPEEYKDDLLQRPIQVETLPDGEVIERVIGESTVPMTIFNSTNVLVGIGILALPLALRYSGWVIGVTFLTLAALLTSYTAVLLAKCLDISSASTTYGDIAFLALGSWGRGLVEVVFVLELLAANVALIILFADSMSSLIPSADALYWKILVAIGLLPLNFVPFKSLSISSVVGIICTISLFVLVVVDGLIKPLTPGSLREVAVTHAFPANWRTIPLSFGLFMAPWGGHAVFPAIYRDMRHPQKFNGAIRTTYGFTYGLDLSLAVVGYLMFGEQVLDEVTANLLGSASYPRALSLIIVVLIAMIPITKMPLSNRPVMDTFNKKFMIDPRQMDPEARTISEKSTKHRLARATIAIAVNIVELGVALAIPDFDSIMALMGSAFCFFICVILPLIFYLRIFWGSDELTLFRKVFCFFAIAVSAALAIVGTIFAILPKEKLGLEPKH